MSGASVIPSSQTRSSYSGSGGLYWLNVRIHISSGFIKWVSSLLNKTLIQIGDHKNKFLLLLAEKNT
jgi:hypothetical protein